MMEPVIVANILREAVAKVSAKLLPTLGRSVQFMNAPDEEAEHKLIEQGRLQEVKPDVQKYPLVILFHDFPERIGGSSGYYGTVTIPKLIIVTDTVNTYQSEQRYEHTFEPILYPIYTELLRQIVKHRSVVVGGVSSLEHTKIDRLYWGTKPASKPGERGGQGLSDYLDAIELQNLSLTLQQHCKC